MNEAKKSTAFQDFVSPVKMPPSRVEVKPYGKWGRYHIKAEGETDWRLVPSVTTITGQLDKSRPLMYWAAGQAIEFLIKELFTPLVEHDFEVTPEMREALKDLIHEEPKEIYKKAKAYHKQRAEEEAEIGTLIHLRILQWFAGYREKPKAPELLIPFEAFLKWTDEWKPEPIHLEKIVGSPKSGGWGGRGDFVGFLKRPIWKKKRLYAIDFKATGGIYKEDPLQVAGYGYAWEDMYPGYPIDGTAVLRLDKKTGMPEFKEWGKQESRDNLAKFRLLLEYWHKENKKV